MPGLALAGGVLVAAIVALLLIGGSEPDRNGPMPAVTGPTATRIIPGNGGVAGETRRGNGKGGAKGSGAGSSAAESQYGTGVGRGAVLGESARSGGSGSAAESQYGTGIMRGTVLGGFPGPG
jgi:hypothetical protein